MLGDDLVKRIRGLNAPNQGMRYHSGHSGERRFNERTGEAYWTNGEPATLTVYGDRAIVLKRIIDDCEQIADALDPAPPTEEE